MIHLAWVFVALPVVIAIYTYLAYPLILWVMARFNKTDVPKTAAELPTVSVVIPAYNEERQIAGAIDALLAQNYPRELLQVLILSDASTDRTDEIVADYAPQGVELLRMEERSGKTKAENLAAARLRGEIIVNSDSSIRLDPTSIRELVGHMADPSVGVASGRDISVSERQKTGNVTEAGYVNYEMWVRTLETATGGIVGASGSCYAIRAELHRIPIREDLSRDFSAALTAREHGFRAVSVDSAICFVPRTSSLQREYRRKVRTMSRGMDTLYSYRHLLDPVRYTTFAWKLFSHKVCRWLLPLSVLPAIVGLAILAPTYTWARIVLLVGAIIGGLAVAGAYWPENRSIPRLVSLAAFGTAANVAVLKALWSLVAGHHDHVWEPTRRSV
ncbi:MAG: glycosyltransferase [Gemmatimonadota bacterium]|nr:glycosyltransferase [Gemmatimonadota bacterium]